MSTLDSRSRDYAWGPGGWRDNDDPERRVVVDGEHYLICDEKGSLRFRGFGGHRFDIEFFDGRRVNTTNLMHQGTVPAKWRERFPDNARFVLVAEASQVEQIAPYPSGGEVTAEGLATALAAHAYFMFRRQIDAVSERDRSETGVLVNEYGVIYLLRHLADAVGAEKADEVAQDLWREWSDGEGLGLDLARWLRGYGVNPGRIADLVARPEPQDGESRG